MPRGHRETIEPGIYWDAIGYELQACVRRERGHTRIKHAKRQHRVPSDPPLVMLRARLRELENECTKRADRRDAGIPKAGTMQADAASYLRKVASMESIRTRTINIGHWVAAFGADTPRDTITDGMIREQMERFAIESRPNDKKRNSTRTDLPDFLPPRAAATRRHLLNALRHMFSVLDGSGTDPERNPAWKVPLPMPEAAMARALPILIETGDASPWRRLGPVLRILRAMPRTRKSRKGAPPNITRIRLGLMVTLGITPKEIRKLRPEHVVWTRDGYGHVEITGRRKGKGAKPRTVPITKHSRIALRAYIRANGFAEKLDATVIRNVFDRCCTRIGYAERGYRPYDLRHTFATELMKVTGDIFVVQRQLGHGNVKTTERYLLGSLDDRMRNAQALMNMSAHKRALAQAERLGIVIRMPETRNKRAA